MDEIEKCPSEVCPTPAGVIATAPTLSSVQVLRWDQRLSRSFADVVFPPVCVHCDGLVERSDAEDTLRHVCTKCAAKIEFANEPCCSTCGHPFYGELTGTRMCEHCEGLSPVFSEGRTAVLFKGAARALVHGLKYHGALYALHDVETLLKKSSRVMELARGAVLVPVPLHPRKERERGYNQGRLIAECMIRAVGGDASGARVEMLLRRVADTVSQTSLDRTARRANLKNAFSLAPGANINASSKYVIVDDVFTTGSTLNSCASVLRRAGCTNIHVLTFGHG